MRSSISIALTLGLFLLLGPAPQADADTTTAVHMVLLEGSTGNLVCSGAPGGPGGTGFVDGDCSANPGDHLKFAITMYADSAGVGAWSLDLAWDQQLQNALELVKVEPVTEFYRGFVDPGPPQVTIGYTFAPPGGTILQQDSSPTQEGRIEQITSGTPNILTDTISETSFRAATATFVVDGTTATDLQLGFYRTDGAVMSNSEYTFITPQFGSFAINAPEPSGTLLALASLSSLAILAHRRRRSD